LDDMETAFLNTDGPLCDKLMATMQAAKRPGADVRCLNAGISSSSAFIRLAKPEDTNSDYGKLWLDINLWTTSGTFTGDPIDELQKQFDIFKETSSIEVVNSNVSIYPNPTDGIIKIESDQNVSNIKVIDLNGKILLSQLKMESDFQVDLSSFDSGIYFIVLENESNNRQAMKVVLSR